MSLPTRLCVAAAALATLGGGLAVASRPASDGEAVRVERTVKKALHAGLVEKGYRRACRFATQAGRRRLLRGYNSSSGPDFASCAAIIRDEVESPGNRHWIRRLRERAVVDVLWVDGDRARVRVAEDDSKYAGKGHLLLRKTGHAWRIANSDLIPFGG